jgi:hypothetical protein
MTTGVHALMHRLNAREKIPIFYHGIQKRGVPGPRLAGPSAWLRCWAWHALTRDY